MNLISLNSPPISRERQRPPELSAFLVSCLTCSLQSISVWLRFIVFIAAGIAWAPCHAAQINCFLELGLPHQLSNASSLPKSTRFQIGVFTGGFSPTTANYSQWSAHWRSRAEAVRDPDFNGMDAVIYVEENPEPFIAGAQLYVWGYVSLSDTNSECLLFTDPSWTMPDAENAFSPPQFLDVGLASTKILGSVNLATTAVSFAPVAASAAPSYFFIDWKSQHFFLVQRENAYISGPLADPDQDGVANLLEYLFGASPTMEKPLSLEISAGPQLSIHFQSPPSVRLAWTLQESLDLLSWTPAPLQPRYQKSLTTWSVGVGLSSAKRFWRLSASDAVPVP